VSREQGDLSNFDVRVLEQPVDHLEATVVDVERRQLTDRVFEEAARVVVADAVGAPKRVDVEVRFQEAGLDGVEKSACCGARCRSASMRLWTGSTALANSCLWSFFATV
jgi:hypothetical protein